MVVFVIIRLHSMFFVIIALFRVFTKSMNHFGCFLQNCLTTLNVYNQVQLLCVLLHFRLVQFACFHLCTVTLIVSLQSIYLLCMFACYWTYIECFHKLSAITLHVLPRKTLLYMFRIKWPCHFECSPTIIFTSCVGFYSKHTK